MSKRKPKPAEVAALDAAGDRASAALIALGEQLTLQGMSVGGRRGRGRPPGARNRKTIDQVTWAEEVCGHVPPLVLLADLAAGEPVMLAHIEQQAKALRCATIDAAELCRRIWNDLLPYWGSRAPLEVQVQGRLAMAIDIPAPTGLPGDRAGQGLDDVAAGSLVGVFGQIAESVEYQDVTGGDDAAV